MSANREFPQSKQRNFPALPSGADQLQDKSPGNCCVPRTPIGALASLASDSPPRLPSPAAWCGLSNSLRPSDSPLRLYDSPARPYLPEGARPIPRALPSIARPWSRPRGATARASRRPSTARGDRLADASGRPADAYGADRPAIHVKADEPRPPCGAPPVLRSVAGLGRTDSVPPIPCLLRTLS